MSPTKPLFYSFWLALAVFTCIGNAWAGDCPALPVDEIAVLKTVYDGDTLQLSDNRRVRLISINTPELAQDNQPAQPLALEARTAALNFLQGANALALSFGERQRDRYGRLLAHLSHPQRGSLEVHLMEQGLAFPIAVPPDIEYTKCLHDIAEQAREQKRGIWNHPYWQAIPATASDRFTEGFRRVCGEIAKVDRAGTLWLELEGDLVIRINRDDWPYFENSDFALNKADNWLGKKIELWGWLQDRSNQKELMRRGFKPWSIQARTPYVLRWIEQCD